MSPLVAAAAEGHVEVVKLLLMSGSADMRTKMGDTALHFAARGGFCPCVAVLLDRGCDHHVRNSRGETALDVAMSNGRTAVVRLMETRVCPFFASLEIEDEGFLRTTWEQRWMTLHRARPWDNPAISRSWIAVDVFNSREKAMHAYRLEAPSIRVTDTSNPSIVCFEMSGQQLSRSTSLPKALTARCRMSSWAFAWLSNVLHPDFPSGRGPAFDAYGRIILPPAAVQWMASFSTSVFTTPLPTPAPATPAPSPAPAPQRAPMAAPPVPQRSPASSFAPGMPAAAPAMHAGGAYPSAASAAAAPAPLPSPAVHTGLHYDLDSLTFDAEPPSEFLCPISLELMLDPVLCVGDGHTYSRSDITRWLQEKRTSPKTNARLSDVTLVPNHQIRSMIADWIEKHKVTSKSASAVPSAPAAPAPAAPIAGAGSGAPHVGSGPRLEVDEIAMMKSSSGAGAAVAPRASAPAFAASAPPATMPAPARRTAYPASGVDENPSMLMPQLPDVPTAPVAFAYPNTSYMQPAPVTEPRLASAL